MRVSRAVVAWGLVGCISVTSATAFELPDGLAFVDLDDLDRWRDEGILREDEWNQLMEWSDEPLNLNSATPDDLLLLPGVDETAAREIVAARNARPFTDFSDLARHPVFADALGALIAFIAVDPKAVGASGRLRQRVSDTQNDGVSARAHGFLRLSPTASVEIGLAQSNGGESPLVWNSKLHRAQAGDASRLTRGYVSWTGDDAAKTVVAGDFSVGSGVGLILNTARYKYPSGVRPNDTTVARQRGAAVEWQRRGFNGVAFASRNALAATLPAAITGLSRSRSVERAVVDELIGGRIETEYAGWRVGGTVTAQRFDARTPTPIDGYSETAKPRAAVDFDTTLQGVRWRGELADAGALGGWTELSSRTRRATTLLSLYSLPTDFDNPHGSKRSDRQGMFARVLFRPKARWQFGGQIESERELSTAVASQAGRVWFAAPITRTIRMGVSGRWDDRDILRRGDSSWQTVEWARVSLGDARVTARVIQRDDEDEATCRVSWSPGRRWSLGVSMDIGGNARWSEGLAMREASAQVSAWPSRAFRARVVGTRSWRGSSVGNRANVTIDYRWGD